MFKRKKLLKLLEERPKVTLPEPGTLERYVQLYIFDKPFLRCGIGTSVDSTGSILEETLEEFKICPESKQKWNPAGPWYPVESGQYYKVVGSGNCLLRSTKKTHREAYEFLLSINTDDFRDYPLGVDWQHLQKLKDDIILQHILSLRLVSINNYGHIKENVL